jgi:hypothetical protein
MYAVLHGVHSSHRRADAAQPLDLTGLQDPDKTIAGCRPRDSRTALAFAGRREIWGSGCGMGGGRKKGGNTLEKNGEEWRRMEKNGAKWRIMENNGGSETQCGDMEIWR